MHMHTQTSALTRAAAQVTNKNNPITRVEDGEPATPFDMGGGHVVPSKALDPGLVYNASRDDYDRRARGEE
jgi:hypothetical protein